MTLGLEMRSLAVFSTLTEIARDNVFRNPKVTPSFFLIAPQGGLIDNVTYLALLATLLLDNSVDANDMIVGFCKT